MRNLLSETIERLADVGKTLDDIQYIVANGHEITVGNFIALAKDFNYDEGFGHQYVPDDLTIVGADWWFVRGEYDGSEWWDYQTKPKRPDKTRHIAAIDGEEFSGEKYKYEQDDGGVE